MNLINSQRNSQSMNVNIDPLVLDTITCPSCRGNLFSQVHLLKRVPKLMVGSPSDIPLTIPIWRCVSCFTILTEFLPDGILDNSAEGNDEL